MQFIILKACAERGNRLSRITNEFQHQASINATCLGQLRSITTQIMDNLTSLFAWLPTKSVGIKVGRFCSMEPQHYKYKF